MSHTRVKAQFKEIIDPWGSEQTKTIYAWHNNTADYVTVYDGDGKILFSGTDEEIYAIMQVLGPYKDGSEIGGLAEGVEAMTMEDMTKCGL